MLAPARCPQNPSFGSTINRPTHRLHRAPRNPYSLATKRFPVPPLIPSLPVMRFPLRRHPPPIFFLSRFFPMSHCSAAGAVSTVDAEGGGVDRSDASKARLRGVVFDMDGTLTVPVIDFQAMYKAVLGEDTYVELRSKNPSGIDILHQIEGWSPDRQHKAYQVIAQFEKEGIDRLQIMPGASELCQYLDSKKIRELFPRMADQYGLTRGLITRNVKEAVDIFHNRFGITFSPALSREFRPYKPDPAPLLHICSTWGIEPHEVVMIGDSLKDDVACGKRAGAYTFLLDEAGRYGDPQFSTAEHKPDFKVSSLSEVLVLLQSHFHPAP